MIVLGLDCSTKCTNVGVARDGEVLSEINLELGRAQSSRLPLLVEDALARAKVTIAEVGLIAVANGPGYFTGIRTGVAYAGALAAALKIKVVPLLTLELFVFDLKGRCGLLAPVIRARQNNVYAALYNSDGKKLTPLIEPVFVSSAEFADILKAYPDALLVGSDVAGYPELAALSNQKEGRLSGFGGQAAILGALYQKCALPPSRLRGNYLRKPDIGSG